VFTRPASNQEHRWTKAVAVAAHEAGTDAPLPAAPYRVELEFHCQRPKRPSHPHPSRHDLDKLVRAVCDGLVQGGLLTDDRHVVELHAVKTWATEPGSEGVSVTITSAATTAAREAA